MGIPVCKGTRHHNGANEEDFAGVITALKQLKVMIAIAFSDIGDYLDFGSGGVKARRLAEIEPMKLSALKTYRMDMTRRTFGIRLHDQGKALTTLLKIPGGLRSRMDLTNGV
jgi:hypothetical protein